MNNKKLVYGIIHFPPPPEGYEAGRKKRLQKSIVEKEESCYTYYGEELALICLPVVFES